MNISFSVATRIFLWAYATIVLPTWALISSLPLFGLFIEGATDVERLGDAAFLFTSFFALAGFWGALALIAAPGGKASVSGFLRGKPGFVSAYATLWMVAYWGFKSLIV
ncbi:MAG: hypothetical protein AAF216_00240 [Pseudomonadota bacterium]